MGRLLLIGLMVLLAAWIGLLGRSQGDSHIQGRSDQGWTIDIQGSRGTFTTDDRSWVVEIIFGWLGQGEFSQSLWLLGRQRDNYLLGFALLNIAGEDFAVWQYDYKRNELLADRFHGSYDVGSLETEPPTAMPSYLPEGAVPGYTGTDFQISSPYAQVTPIDGRVRHEDLDLIVYPVYNAKFGGSFEEIWSIGVSTDPQDPQAYHLIFYSHQEQSWVISLASGRVRLLPLGRAVLGQDQVQISRSVSLKKP